MIKKLAEDYAAAKQGLRDYTKARAEGKHEPLRAGLAKHRQVIKGVERHIATLTPVDRSAFDSHVSAAKSGKVLIQTPSPSAPVVAAPEVSRSHPLPVQRRMEKERPPAQAAATPAKKFDEAAFAKATQYGHAPPAAPRELTPLRLDSSSRESAHVKAAIDAAHDGEATGVTAHELGKKLGVSTADAHKVLRSAEALGHVKATEYVRSAGHSKKTYGDRAEMQKTPGMSTTYVHKEHAHFYEKPEAAPTFLKDSARNHALGLSKQANSLTALAEQGHDKHISALHAHQDALEAHIDAKSPESDLEHHKVMIRKHKAAPDDSLRAEVQVHAQSAYKAEKQHAEAKSWDQKPHDPKAAAAADRASQMRSDAIRAGKTDFLGRPTDSFRKEWEAKNAPKAKRLVSAAKPAAHSVRVVNLQVPRARVIAGEAAMRLPYQVTAPRATPKAGMKAPASAIRIGKKGGRFILSASGQKHYV
jgi:hypothetical protein